MIELVPSGSVSSDVAPVLDDSDPDPVVPGRPLDRVMALPVELDRPNPLKVSDAVRLTGPLGVAAPGIELFTPSVPPVLPRGEFAAAEALPLNSLVEAPFRSAGVPFAVDAPARVETPVRLLSVPAAVRPEAAEELPLIPAVEPEDAAAPPPEPPPPPPPAAIAEALTRRAAESARESTLLKFMTCSY